ncbi:MAG: MATE family efflux transporter [Fervidobacterium sp.]|uniref:MATE family efflux transporter n=1 Tax=Fervidobacterium sp. TaxID=1871331 RepID=UPI004048EDEC
MINLENDFRNITKNLFKLSVPTMIGFSIQSLYDLVDMFWIGKISYKAIAGVVIFSTIFWLVEILNEIIGASSVSLISQSYGSGDKRLTSRIIEQTLIFKALVAVIASTLLIAFFKPLVWFFSKDREVVESAIKYGYIRIFFMPIFFMTYSTFTALRNIGHATLAMTTMALGAFFNIILDPVFIFEKIPYIGVRGLGLGIEGAAWATVLSSFFPLIWGLTLLSKGIDGVKISFKGLLKLDRLIDRKLITIGLPSGIEMLLRNLSYTVLIKLSSLFGSEIVTVFGIIERVMGFSVIPIFGLSIGSSTLVGFALGKNNERLAKKVAFMATLYSIIINIVILILIASFKDDVFRIFTTNQTVIEIGTKSVKFVLTAMFFISVTAGISSAFFGSGKTSIPFISSIISRWGVMVPFVLLSILTFKLGINGLWLAFPVSEFAEASVMLYAFLKSNWTKKRVI